MGASVQGALIAGQEVGAVLVDITPHSLGIKCLDKGPTYFERFAFRFAPIIHRNTALPTTRAEVFNTVADRQDTVEIEVYQGESDDVRNNHRVGNFRIAGLAPVPAGNPIVVQLDLTLDGTLRVSAREKATGLVKQITIDNALARFQRDELVGARERLDELFGNSRGLPPVDDAGDFDEDADLADDREQVDDLPELVPGPAAGQREAVQARALVEKAERLLTTASAEDRTELERHIGRIRERLTDRQWPELAAACNELSDVLFYLEEA
jgi:molecular chaperone DnaK